jgi:integrase
MMPSAIPYILSRFGDCSIEDIGPHELQLFLNALSEKYSNDNMGLILSLLKDLMEYARRRKYIEDDPAEDLFQPKAQTHPKQWADNRELMILFDAVNDPMDKCYLACAIFLALRSAELFGMRWKDFDFEELTFAVSASAYRGVLYEGVAKTDDSHKPLPLAEEILRSVLRWRDVCPDSSSEALVFPCVPKRGRNKGKATPWKSYEYLNRRIRPLAQQLGINTNQLTNRVLRRTALDDVAKSHSERNAHGLARHTTGGKTLRIHYLHSVPKDVRDAVETRTARLLALAPNHEKNAA